MYEQHFGLKKRPFRANVAGTNVFVGPQIAATMAGLKKALVSNDAIATVSGPVGSGKTTRVTRALESIGENSSIIHVARMRLNSDDVLEFLLDELGIEERPSGTIQKFSLFRRRLKELQDSNSRVFISVEDAKHLGVDALAELEALTASDAGDSDGAGIVLMGDEGLDKFLNSPELVRVNQRVRQRHTIVPLCAAELRGYLRHCFRLAGGDFEQVFQANAAPLLHHLSDGIPRISNNLVESAMAAAADQDLPAVPSELLARIAENEYGLSAAEFDLSEPESAEPIAPAKPEPEPVVEAAAEPEIVTTPVLEPEPVYDAPPQMDDVPALEASPWPDAPTEAEPALEEIPELPVEEPVIVFADPIADESSGEEEDVPELIQDTLPDLEILAPQLAAAADLKPDPIAEAEPEPVLEAMPEPVFEAEPEPVFEAEPEPVLETMPEPVFEAEPEPVFEPTPEPVFEAEPEPVFEPTPEPVFEAEPEPTPIPELQLDPEPQSTAESSGAEVPAWDRDPTMAELKPDIAALEQAMAFAHAGDPDPVPDDSGPVPEPEPEEPEEPEVIPEITLDHAISQRIESNLIDEKGEISAPNSENVSASADAQNGAARTSPPKTNKKADAEIEKITDELARAKSIEDMDDRMAETLFGDEINFVAAQILANPPPADESANDNSTGVAAGELVPNGSPPPAPALAISPDPVPELVVETEETAAPGVEVTLQARKPLDQGLMDLSASQRLKTVRALNADPQPTMRDPETGQNDAPADSADAPDSIEDQINTSMTQTLKALNVRPPVNEDDVDDGEQKGGFFSRFKRS